MDALSSPRLNPLGRAILETLAYYLPIEENLNIITVVASQGDCPQKLMGASQGDRFIVRELLSGKAWTPELVPPEPRLSV